MTNIQRDYENLPCKMIIFKWITNTQIKKEDSITSAKEGLAKWLIYYDNKFYVEILWKENTKGHWTTFEFRERNNEDYH